MHTGGHQRRFSSEKMRINVQIGFGQTIQRCCTECARLSAPWWLPLVPPALVAVPPSKLGIIRLAGEIPSATSKVLLQICFSRRSLQICCIIGARANARECDFIWKKSSGNFVCRFCVPVCARAHASPRWRLHVILYYDLSLHFSCLVVHYIIHLWPFSMYYIISSWRKTHIHSSVKFEKKVYIELHCYQL